MKNTIEPKENIDAWQADTYSAWVERFGAPAVAAERIRNNPAKMVGSLLPHLGPIENKRIVNIMGSHGLKAIALSVLGAKTTVIDISESNRKYALDVAEAAGTKIEYHVDNILDCNRDQKFTKRFDIAFAEMGIIHYFTDLVPFMKTIKELLDTNGRFVLKDFHPVSTKLIKYRGSTAKVRKYKVDGDYFSKELERRPVSYSKHVENGTNDNKTVLLRNWTMGEIITAVASSGMKICSLIEEPNESSEVFDKGIPKTFTLQAVVE